LHRSLFAVGRVVKAIGIRGEVVVRLLSGNRERWKGLVSVRIGHTDQETEELTIEYAQDQARPGLRVKFSDVRNRTEAKQLAGKHIFVEEVNRITLPEGTYFVDSIVGLDVVDESGGRIGSVKEVLKMPAQDLYVIEHNGRELMVPAVREFIREINLHTKVVTVRLIEGFGIL
jgi:16S rRNA processing protein RimM